MTKYVLLIAATTVLLFAGLSYFFYAREQSALEKVAVAQAETVKVRADLDTVTKVNKQQNDTITALRGSFKAASSLAADLAGDVETITTEIDSLRDENTALREANDEVNAYWRTVVPHDLQKLYPGTNDHRAN